MSFFGGARRADALASRRARSLGGMLALLVGCSGSLGGMGGSTDDDSSGGEGGEGAEGGDGAGGSGSGGSGPGSCGKVDGTPVRRLSRAEYAATLRDLFPGIEVGAPKITPDPAVHGFENRADKLYATENNVAEFAKAATEVATKAVAAIDKVVPCAKDADQVACGRTFIADFGQRAFRRPLGDDEKSRYGAFFEKQRAALGFPGAVQLVLEGMLQSVHFLYRTDLGDAGAEQGGRERLRDWDVASRLSYLLWGTMPDAALFDAAKNGKLRTDSEILAQADRLMKDDRARGQLVDFHRQWLAFDHLTEVYQREGDKDPTKYASYTADLRAALREESDRLTAMVMGNDGPRTLAGLLTSRDTYVNGPLADLYGATKPSSGWQKVTLSDQERGGILTRGSFLASHAHKVAGSPPLRAVYVMERLLCLPKMTADPTADTSEPVTKPGEEPKTNRQLFEARVNEKASCKACHQFIDPIGFTFEHYDAIGRWRAEDNGSPVNASGALVKSDVDGDVKNAIELSAKLAESKQVRACMARQYLAFATGVDAEEEDDCRVGGLVAALEKGKGDVRSLLLALVRSPDFLTRASAR